MSTQPGSDFVFFADLSEAVSAAPDSTVSKTIYADQGLKAVMFSFDAGQELSEHTATMPAIIQIVRGDARITLGDAVVEAGAGAWIHMAAGLPHSIHAHTPTLMLLLMLRH